MLFKFLKYLQPTSYFALKNKANSSVFPHVEDLPEPILIQLKKDAGFISETAANYDLSWQALQKGYIGDAKKMTTFKRLPLVDEYRFIKKYFSPIWSVYVLIIRLLSFKNPFKEINCWLKNKSVIRSNFLDQPITHPKWETFKSALLEKQPKVSVVIPTLNRYEYLKDVLEDLEKQHYKNFEVIVVDQSQPYNEAFYARFDLEKQIVRQEERALWLARNTAIEMATSDLILLFDDDSRVDPDWIENHIKCIDFFDASISSGVSISLVGAEVPKNYAFFRISDQIDTGNVLIKKDVFKTLGLFDRQFEKQRMGDGEYGLRCHIHGYLNISNPYAKRLHLKVGSGGLREMGSWDGFRPKKLFGPRPVPSVLYLFRSYFGNSKSRYELLKTIPTSIIPYRFKRNKLLLLVGVLLSILLLPLVLFQVMRSWHLASRKLDQGPLIKSLN